MWAEAAGDYTEFLLHNIANFRGDLSFCYFEHSELAYPNWLYQVLFSGQSYNASTIIIYDSRVVPDLNLPHITTLDS